MSILKSYMIPPTPAKGIIKNPLFLAASFGDVRHFQALKLSAELGGQEGTEAWGPWGEGLWISGHLDPIYLQVERPQTLSFQP